MDSLTQETIEVNKHITLEKDGDSILRCVGRVKGYNPVYIPRKAVLARKIIEYCHLQTLHGGVTATTCKVREKFGISQLR